MVAEVSNHDWNYIMSRMPLAQCYQARTIWFDKTGIEWKVLGENENPLNKIIK